MYSEKSGEKDILGEYKSNSMKGWKLWTVILYLPLSWTVFSLDFFQISGIFSVSMVKLEKLVQSFYTSEQRGKGLVSFVLVLLSNTNKQQENNFYRIKNLWKLSLLSSVQFSRSVVSDSLWLHGLQNTRLPCPSPTPRACSNSYPSSQWCHPTISSCHPLLLLPSVFPTIRVFSNESVLPLRWPKYWSFSFSISPSNEYSVLISFRMDWLDLLVVQGTLKSLLQHHSSKASILRCSAFFTVQLPHPYNSKWQKLWYVTFTIT